MQVPKRHFGMDWLRIGAFALLILFHCALYFSPGHWVIKAPETQHWLVYPMAALTPWRLMVLFAVSGFATAAMIARAPRLGAFFSHRSKRLLIPLLFGMAILTPPQSWVQLTTQAGLHESFARFWLHDNFSFGPLGGLTLPHWMHLWFLGYLWAYTGLLVLALWLIPIAARWPHRCAAWLMQGNRLLIVPLVLISTARLALDALHLSGAGGMLTDWIGDLHYIPAFLLGFALARVPALWSTITRVWRPALLTALLALEILWALLFFWGDMVDLPRWAYAIDLLAESAMAWAMLPVVFHLANTLLNRDHAWRAPLARAVFPAYIVHQTVIVLMGWILLDWSLPFLPAFVLMCASVLSACALAWWIARTLPLAGMLLGMPHMATQDQSKAPIRLAF